MNLGGEIKELRQPRPTDHDGQVLVVDDALHLGDDDAASVLVVEIGRLPRCHDVQVVPDAVVFANPDCVHDGQKRLFVDSAIA